LRSTLLGWGRGTFSSDSRFWAKSGGGLPPPRKEKGWKGGRKKHKQMWRAGREEDLHVSNTLVVALRMTLRLGGWAMPRYWTDLERPSTRSTCLPTLAHVWSA